MTREIIVGLENCSNLAPGYTLPSGDDTTWIIDTHPSLYTGNLDTFYIPLRRTGAGGTITFVVFSMETVDTGKIRFIKQSNSTTYSLIPGQTDVSVTLSGESVAVWEGNVIGIRVHCNSSSDRIGFAKPSPNNWNLYYGGIHDTGEWHESYPYGEYSKSNSIAFKATGIEPDGGGGGGGTGSADACQSTPQLGFSEGYNWHYFGYGRIDLKGVGHSGSDYYAEVEITTPWGDIETYVIIYLNYTHVWTRVGANPPEYWSVTPTFISEGFGGRAKFTECWWRESDIYYVKTDGDDDSFGVSWATAFKTITKAANTVPDGGKVYIGFGTYNGETTIEPINKGVLGIRYNPVTSSSSSGTGSVIIPI